MANFPIKPGDRVNGYNVIDSRLSPKHRRDGIEGQVILCDRATSNPHDTRWVTWVVYGRTDVAHGHYFNDEKEAHSDFRTR